MPPSKPSPIFICVMPFSTTSPKPPAEIMADTTTMESAIMMVWLMPVSMVGKAKGNCTLKSNWRGVAPNDRAASITFSGTCRMPNHVSRTTGGMAKMMVAKAPGTVPNPKNNTAGIR